jgi:sugar O-acyltransferase (sialic acid O-acetyltransferase NeuD family)
MKKAIIVGAGKHGEVYLSYLRSIGITILGFIDDDKSKVGIEFQGTKVIGTFEDLFSKKFKDKITDVYCPIGDNILRKDYLKTLKNEGYETPSFIHPSVILAPDVNIGEAAYILQGNYVMPFTTIGNYFMMNMGGTIGHHVSIGEGVFISSGARIGASIHISDYAYFGTGCTIKTGIESIGTSAIIGAGAVVINNVEDYSVVAGNPAKILRTKKYF